MSVLVKITPLTQDAAFKCYQPTGMYPSIFLRSSWQETLWHIRIRPKKLLLLQSAIKKKPWLTLSAFGRSLVFYTSFHDDTTIYEIRNNTAHFWSSGGRRRWFYGIIYTENWWFGSHLLSNQVYVFECQCIVNMSRLWSEKLSPWQPFAMVTTMNAPDSSAICTLCLCLEEGTW